MPKDQTPTPPTEPGETETSLNKIEAAAIMDHDGTVYSVPRPGRHHDVIRFMIEQGRPKPISGEQGFILTDHRFIRRKAAARVAIRAGQIEKLKWPPNLYSEDLW